MSIILGGEESVLNYSSANGDPPYFVSLGNAAAKGSFLYDFMGEETEGCTRNLVPYETARNVLNHYVVTGELSKAIAWEEE